MPVTKEETNVAQEVIQILTGNHGEAEAYAEAPGAWLDSHGYSGVSAEAVQQCGTGYGGGASASASAGGGGGYAGPPPPVSAGVEAQLDYIVYNNYYEDNSITNNIENHGNLDFQQVVGDGNVVAGDDSQIQTGSGIQAGGDVDIDDSAVSTGSGNASNISDIDDSTLDVNVNQGEGDQLVDESVNTATNVGDGQAQAGVGGDATQIEVEEAPVDEPPPDEAEPIV